MRLNDPAQPIWTSRFFFLMASIGFAVGLGNIWRFPYVAGESGGGAFVLLYLLFAFSILWRISITSGSCRAPGPLSSFSRIKAVTTND